MRLARLAWALTIASWIGVAALVGLFALAVASQVGHEREMRALVALASRADAVSAAGDAVLVSGRGVADVTAFEAEAAALRAHLRASGAPDALVAEASAAIDRMVAVAERTWTEAGAPPGAPGGAPSPLGVPAAAGAAMVAMADAGVALDDVMQRLEHAHQDASARRALASTLGFGAAALVFGALSLAVLRLLHRRVGAPVLRTAAAVERFAAGDRAARSGVAGRDEVGRLGAAIDGLMAAVSAHEDELSGTNGRLRLALARQQALFDALPANVAVVDAAGVIVAENARWRAHGEAAGRPAGTSDVGVDYLRVCDAADADRSGEAPAAALGLRRVLAGEAAGFALEYPCHTPDRPAWYRMSVSPVPGDAARPAGAVVMHVDVTERKLAELELAAVAHRDRLTGLWSRAGFVAELAARLDAHGWAPAAVVATLDVEDFRSVNDAHGFDVGDQLLTAIGARLADAVGAEGLAARTGGDTFLVYAPARPDEGPEDLAARLARATSRPYEVDGFEHELELAIGYTASGRTPRAVEELIREAELALYDGVNARGGGVAAFTAQLDAAAQERVRVAHELRGALAREEFALVYQPKVVLATGRVVAAEALVRWRHPERGLLPPGAFVPVAERSGLIAPLGAWVLGEACRALARWQQAGLPPLLVAVNVSVEQLAVGDFAFDVARALAAEGVSPSRLTLEITESVFMRESPALRDQLARLHDLGVRLALDDFGTGFSSLQYLKAYRFDEVKVDRGFVRDVARDGYSRGLVATVLGLARTLEAEAVAEGVEEVAQVEALRALGCTVAQGFHFSVPLPEADLVRLVASGAVLPVAKA
jgi:diguanylate cyclase (GGDEF)-like protein